MAGTHTELRTWISPRGGGTLVLHVNNLKWRERLFKAGCKCAEHRGGVFVWDGHRNSKSDRVRLRHAVNLTLIASVLSK